MANAPQCDQCRAILDEFRSAVAELSPERMDELWSYREAFMKMVGGTEEDAQRVEELGGEYQFRPRFPGSKEALDRDRYYVKIHAALRKMFVHRFRTGHNDLFDQLFKR